MKKVTYWDLGRGLMWGLVWNYIDPIACIVLVFFGGLAFDVIKYVVVETLKPETQSKKLERT